MALKNELDVNHVWTSGTPDELDKLVSGYLNNGWKMMESRTTQVDRYNRILEMVYIFVRTDNTYSGEEVDKAKASDKKATKLAEKEIAGA